MSLHHPPEDRDPKPVKVARFLFETVAVGSLVAMIGLAAYHVLA